MKIKDKFELLALHRCLLEAKFSPSPNDGDIAGSPIVAKLANEVVDELVSIDGSQWNEWRIAENKEPFVSRLISALKQQNLEHVPSNEQRLFIIDALAPLKATDKTVTKIITEVFGGNSI